MAKTKTFTIKGYSKPITVKKLSLGSMLSLLGKKDVPFQTLLSEDILPLCCNLTIENIDEFNEVAPEEIKKIWETFKDVNGNFFLLNMIPAVKKILIQIETVVTEDFSSISDYYNKTEA